MGKQQSPADVDGRRGSGAAKIRNIETNPKAVDGPYAWYVLLVLVLVYTLCWMDRSIISILAEDLKARFHLADSELGFLYGTAFGVFYALFGFPLGRLVDSWMRVRLLSICIAVWSVMTVFCGLSMNFGQLVTSRIGVGIGEAAASPSGFSLLSDWFSRARRGTALGLYVSGLFLGSGLALVIGGNVAFHWGSMFAGGPPFGLQGWQAAFLIVGLPGLALAVWVASLREPRRGLSDGTQEIEKPNGLARFFDDVASVVPPFTLIQAARCGRGVFLANIGAALAIAACAWGLIVWSGDLLQWLATSIGYYSAFSAAQVLRHRDPATFALTWKSPAFVLVAIGFGFTSMLNINMSFWTAPLALRGLPIDKATAGLILGATSAVGGMLGVIVGGRVSDFAQRIHPAGRIYVGLASAVIPVPFAIGMCLIHDPLLFFLLNAPVVFVGTMWIPAGAATVQELVLPRMRGTATIVYFLASTLLGSALGPYLIGKVSAAQHNLAAGVLAGLLASPVALVTLFLASRLVQRSEASKFDRARAAGEPAA